MLTKIVLGLGSNKGNRLHYIQKAIKIMSVSQNFLILEVSDFYETEPWGFRIQNNFINCVCIGLYRLGTDKLLSEIKLIEKMIGRLNYTKWHSREIDIDILFFNNRIFHKENITIPHPLLHLRNFVLKPLTDLIPNFIHPVFKKKILTLYKISPDRSKVNLYKSK